MNRPQVLNAKDAVEQLAARAGGRIVIVAGEGEDPGGKAPAGFVGLGKVLASIRGVIVAGGTRTGVAGLVGAAVPGGRGRRASWRVGYLPDRRSAGLAALLDARYDAWVFSRGRGFSVAEPLAYWKHLLAAGVDPEGVRLIGLGGGRLAAFEYRLALAMGARVGLIAGSGRAADDMLRDHRWRGCRTLQSVAPRLPALRAFLKG